MARVLRVPNLNEHMQLCLQSCMDCASICSSAAQLVMENCTPGADLRALHFLQDCADLCELAAKYIIRGSEMRPRICELCADICDRCAVACEHAGRENLLKTCIEVCRGCSRACYELAKL